MDVAGDLARIFFAALGGSVTALVVVGFLLKSLVKQRLDVALEGYKAKLAAQNSKLQTLYTRVYERRAEHHELLVADLCGLLDMADELSRKLPTSVPNDYRNRDLRQAFYEAFCTMPAKLRRWTVYLDRHVEDEASKCLDALGKCLMHAGNHPKLVIAEDRAREDRDGHEGIWGAEELRLRKEATALFVSVREMCRQFIEVGPTSAQASQD